MYGFERLRLGLMLGSQTLSRERLVEIPSDELSTSVPTDVSHARAQQLVVWGRGYCQRCVI